MRCSDLSILDKELYWDSDFECINGNRNCKAVIQRVFERGNEIGKNEITRFIGRKKLNRL